MLNIEHLALFISSVEKGSFTAAAKEHGKSLSTVSSAISGLEDKLGLELFDRTSKYPVLNEHGRAIYPVACNLLFQNDKIISIANSFLSGIEDSITIGVDQVVPIELVEHGLILLANEYPNINLSIMRGSLSDLRVALSEEKVQCIVVLSEGTAGDNYEFVHFTNFEIVGICSPESSLSGTKIVSMSTLASHRQICCKAMFENPGYQQFLIGFETWDVDDFEGVVRLVELDLGWALIPKVVAEKYVAQGTINLLETSEISRTSNVLSAEVRFPSNLVRRPALSFLISKLTQMV
ncbi:LysR family transcriptional regulator [Vibrio sp. McD22-P3]|uniref:LysR family transcriptional regulator n=1 Tax=Vibrio sp. McD22-P3 TaxID=2724880 RepID=UPI001F23066F|nr:LysR family transcriptional regulator [Vibrio sp. McD22-P3]MCF4175688.1 LysR family transcriptional regulator [Vibrio sp. McD22-P3]